MSDTENINKRVELLTDLTADTRRHLSELTESIDNLNLSFLLLCGAIISLSLAEILKYVRQ